MSKPGVRELRYLPDPNNKEEMDRMGLIQAKVGIQYYYEYTRDALALLRECRDALTFYDNDHTTEIMQKLDEFLGGD
jgi:hypothetical protein